MRENLSKGWLVFLALITMAPTLAQTCRDDIPASAPDSRFTANGDGTVADKTTGLTWKQCAEGLSGVGCQTGSAMTFTWQAALQHAADAVFAGSSLWRLPSKKELASLVEQRCYDPAINSGFFPNTPFWPNTTPGVFWSSSPYPYHSGSAWGVGSSNGIVIGYYKSDANYVRLVRGGQ